MSSPLKKKSKSEKKTSAVKSPSSRKCACGHSCHEKHSHLPGYLLMAFGLLSLPFNFDMVGGFEWLKAWPLFLVLVGAVLAARVTLCRTKKIAK